MGCFETGTCCISSPCRRAALSLRMKFMSKMLKQIATPAEWQGGSVKITKLQFICPPSTKKMISDSNRNRFCFKLLLNLTFYLCDWTGNQQACYRDPAFIFAGFWTKWYLQFSASVSVWALSVFPWRRLLIIKALGQLAAESTLTSPSLQHCEHKWCSLLTITNIKIW